MLNNNNVFIKALERGESFGELALIHSTERSGTVIAKQLSQVWCLERRNFRKIVELINKMNYDENKLFLSSIKMLTAMDNELKTILANHLLKQYFKAGDVIFRGILLLFLFF